MWKMLAALCAATFLCGVVFSAAARGEQGGIPFLAGYKNGFIIQSEDGDFRVRLGGYIQTDLWVYGEEDEAQLGGDTLDTTFDVRRARLTVSGHVFRNFAFKVQPDFAASTNILRDGWIELTHIPQAKLRMGQYKQPLSYEWLTSSNDLDFVERAMVVDALTNRDIGAMLHGKLWEKQLEYALGLFNGSGQNTLSDSDDFEYVGRVVVYPLAKATGQLELFKELHVGGFAAFTDRPAGAKSRRGRTQGMFEFFPAVDIAGNRTRVGAELVWFYGPASVKYEYLHAEEDRDGLADDGGDLPSLETNGWYVALTYMLTGEKKKQEGMESGLEAVVRWEECEFEDNSDVLPDNRVEAFTAGFTYYFNKAIKFKLNYTHLEYSNELMTPTSYVNYTKYGSWVGDDGSDIVQARFQLVF